MVAYVDFKSLPTIEAITKELKEFLTHNGVGFFFCYEDDRQSVIDMWIQEGLFVFNVNNGKGDF